MQALVLARVIQTGNQEMITRAVEEFKKFPVTDDLIKVIDEANLPYLVDRYASDNDSAVALIQEHRKSKEAKMSNEKASLLIYFRGNILNKYIGKEVPEHIQLSLSLMMRLIDVEMVQVALQLLTELEISLEIYYNIFDIVKDIRRDIPEAEALYQKIQERIRKFEVVDEYMELDGGSNIDSDVSDSEVSEVHSSSLVSETSVESGFDSDFEEIRMEQEQQTREFQDNIAEVLMMTLAGIIKSGDVETIKLAIETFQDFPFSLQLYQKYEIQSLVLAHASNCDAAKDLCRRISMLEKEEMAKDHLVVSQRITKCIDMMGT
ncbi:unnamed protein product [Caenorhabditis brenneri]